MNEPVRLRFFMENLYGHSVVTINFQDWENLVRADGTVTSVEQIPDKLSGVMRDAEVVAVVGSGFANHNPGIDIVRKDVKDAPMIYNIDHYKVVERLSGHPDFDAILKRTNVMDSNALRETLDSWIWIVGPERDPINHWAKEIPEFIKNARKKR